MIPGAAQHLISRQITGIEPCPHGADVPRALAEPLFGAPDNVHCYALIDGARVSGLAETLETAQLDHACLFLDGPDGPAPAAPWLVRLRPEGKFTRNLFRQSPLDWHLWGQDSLVLLRSSATIHELLTHFRRFTKVRDERGRMVFFRFWDPLVIALYGTARRHDAIRLEQIFGLANGKTVEFIAPLGAEDAVHLALSPDFQRQFPRRAFSFDAEDQAILQEIAFSAFARQLLPWLAGEYTQRLNGRSATAQRAIARHVVATGRRAGLTMKQDFAFLAQMMMTSGGWFWDDDSVPGLRALMAEAPSPKAEALAAEYAVLQRQTPQAELAEQWGALRDWLASLPEDQAITPETFRQMTSRFIPRTAGQIAGAIASTRERLRSAHLSHQRIEGKAVALTLLLGPRFFEDVLWPWAMLPPEKAIQAAWSEVVG